MSYLYISEKKFWSQFTRSETTESRWLYSVLSVYELELGRSVLGKLGNVAKVWAMEQIRLMLMEGDKHLVKIR